MVLSHDEYTGNSASFNLKAAVEREKAVQAIDVHRGYCQLNGLHTQWDALAKRWGIASYAHTTSCQTWNA